MNEVAFPGCVRRVRCWSVFSVDLIVVRCGEEYVACMMDPTVVYKRLVLDGGERGVVQGEFMW